jgi:hypothetical protein
MYPLGIWVWGFASSSVHWWGPGYTCSRSHLVYHLKVAVQARSGLCPVLSCNLLHYMYQSNLEQAFHLCHKGSSVLFTSFRGGCTVLVFLRVIVWHTYTLLKLSVSIAIPRTPRASGRRASATWCIPRTVIGSPVTSITVGCASA